MLGMDEPVHGRLRALVSKAFSQKALARWEDELVGRVGQRTDRQVRRRTARPTWSRSSRSTIRARSSPGCWDCRGGLSAVPAVVDLAAELGSMNPERGLAASAALCEYFAPILDGPPRRTHART